MSSLIAQKKRQDQIMKLPFCVYGFLSSYALFFLIGIPASPKRPILKRTRVVGPCTDFVQYNDIFYKTKTFINGGSCRTILSARGYTTNCMNIISNPQYTD